MAFTLRHNRWIRILLGTVVVLSVSLEPSIVLLSVDTTGSQDSAPKVPCVAARVSYEDKEGSRQQIVETYGKLPLSFEANNGQVDEQVRFLSRGSGYILFLTPEETVLSLQRSALENADSTVYDVVRMQLVGANSDVEVTGLEEQPGKSNYLFGNDPGKWSKGIPQVGKVHYAQVYTGVDMIYYGNQSRLEYDFIVAPDTDPDVIRLQFKGVERLSLEEEGSLLLHTPGGEVVQQAPIVYQEIDGRHRNVEGRYALLEDNNQVGFKIGAYDVTRPLIIDPVIIYSTYLGSKDWDEGEGIVVDSLGNAYLTGKSMPSNFPMLNSLQSSSGGGNDAFVLKLNVEGSALVYSTYLGGSRSDRGEDIAIDGSGNAYVTGFTSSTDFPTKNPLQPILGGGNDAFVLKLNAEGSTLVYSTFLGGSRSDFGNAISVDDGGNTYVTGYTESKDFPLENPLQISSGGGSQDVYLSKLNAEGSALVYSTYLGGKNSDRGESIVVDRVGNTYVTGFTGSKDFPTQNPIQVDLRGSSDAFVLKMNAEGSALVYSTYLGGSATDDGWGIAVDSTGNAYVTGYTYSDDFPTQNPIQVDLRGSSDVFISKLNAEGSALVYSTLLGGSATEDGRAIAVDDLGNAYVTGTTRSLDFPMHYPIQSTKGGGFGAYVSKLDESGSALVYSTYLGGTGNDYSNDIAVDNLGNAYITGYTNSTDFPTQNPFQATNANNDDVFVLKLSSFSTSPARESILPTEGSGEWTMDLNVTKGDQGVRELNGVAAGDTFTIELINNQAISPALGGSFILSYEATKVEPVTSAISGIASLLGAASIKDGTVSFTLAGLSGVVVEQGHVGQIGFKALDGFDGETAITLTKAEIGNATTFENVISTPNNSVVIRSGGTSAKTPSPDFDGDGSVSFRDFIMFAQKFGSKKGDGMYEATFDLDSNGDVGFRDFISFAQFYGKDPSTFVPLSS